MNIASIPLTILGIVVAAVARRLVPNCSAAIVTKIAQNPVPKPSPAQIQYMWLLNRSIVVVKNRA